MLLGFVQSLRTIAATLGFCFAEMSVKENALKYMALLEDKLRR